MELKDPIDLALFELGDLPARVLGGDFDGDKFNAYVAGQKDMFNDVMDMLKRIKAESD